MVELLLRSTAPAICSMSAGPASLTTLVHCYALRGECQPGPSEVGRGPTLGQHASFELVHSGVSEAPVPPCVEAFHTHWQLYGRWGAWGRIQIEAYLRWATSDGLDGPNPEEALTLLGCEDGKG